MRAPNKSTSSPKGPQHAAAGGLTTRRGQRRVAVIIAILVVALLLVIMYEFSFKAEEGGEGEGALSASEQRYKRQQQQQIQRKNSEQQLNTFALKEDPPAIVADPVKPTIVEENKVNHHAVGPAGEEANGKGEKAADGEKRGIQKLLDIRAALMKAREKRRLPLRNEDEDLQALEKRMKRAFGADVAAEVKKGKDEKKEKDDAAVAAAASREAASRYRLAKPLPGQIASDEFFKPEEDYSSWWCGGPPGDKNWFGQKLDPRSYCVFRNVCIKDGQFTMFPKRKEDVPGQHSDIEAYQGLPHCVFRNVGTFYVNAKDKGETLQKARREGRMLGGLTALISSSYGQTHITHFMEPLGQLFYALNIFGMYQDHGEEGAYMSRPLGPTLDGAPEPMTNLHAFNRTKFALKHADLERVLVAGAGGVAAGSFNEQFFRMLYTNRKDPSLSKANNGKFSESDYRPRIIDGYETHNGKCFEELVMAGASYDPFHQTHAPSYYRHRDWFYGFDVQSEDDRAAIVAKLPGLVEPSDAAKEEIAKAIKAAGLEGKARPTRNVVMAHRTSKRKVVNSADLDRWMAEKLPVLLPQYEWSIRSVNYGGLSNVDRVQVSHWADIIIGIHGADLTNLINMKPGSVVIELNMLFFFESRFQEMSNTLQLHYFAWTCTRKQCTPVWDQVVRSRGDWVYDAKTERLQLTESAKIRFGENAMRKFKVHEARYKHTDGWFKWPTDRYAGDSCLGCDLMSCCTSLQETLYGSQRESDIIFLEKELQEMGILMRQAAAAVGTPTVAKTRPNYVRMLEEALADNEKGIRYAGAGETWDTADEKDGANEPNGGKKPREKRSSRKPLHIPDI